MTQPKLIDVPPSPAPLRLEVGKDIVSYRRFQEGKPYKVYLRDTASGRRIATVFAGRKIAERIALCVNKEA